MIGLLSLAKRGEKPARKSNRKGYFFSRSSIFVRESILIRPSFQAARSGARSGQLFSPPAEVDHPLELLSDKERVLPLNTRRDKADPGLDRILDELDIVEELDREAMPVGEVMDGRLPPFHHPVPRNDLLQDPRLRGTTAQARPPVVIADTYRNLLKNIQDIRLCQYDPLDPVDPATVGPGQGIET